MPLLSIIVPMYNAEKYIDRCVQCLLHQTYQDKEIILIDDGSTDNTSSLCDMYAEKYNDIRVIHKANGGVAHARNEGIAVSTGDLIAFMDVDDFIEPQMYEKLVEALLKTGSEVAACSFVKDYSQKDLLQDHQLKKPKVRIYKGSAAVLQAIDAKEHSLLGYVWNKVFKKNAIGGIRFKQAASPFEDKVFTYEVLSSVHCACHIDIPFYHYVYVRGSLAKSSFPRKFEGALDALEDLNRWCKENAPQCLDGLIADYIHLNGHVCECLLDRMEPEFFSKIKRNIEKYREYIPKCDVRTRMYARAILCSWKATRLCGRTIRGLKKLYLTVRRA